jgi:hypothetical protein
MAAKLAASQEGVSSVSKMAKRRCENIKTKITVFCDEMSYSLVHRHLSVKNLRFHNKRLILRKAVMRMGA